MTSLRKTFEVVLSGKERRLPCPQDSVEDEGSVEGFDGELLSN